MKKLWYRLLHGSASLLGDWVFWLVSRLIAVGYFCCSPKRKHSLHLYRTLYPRRNRLFHLWCTFRQYQQFTTIHYDRFLTARGRQPRCISSGWPRLEEAISSTGAILLMSHLGNWEMAARILRAQKSDAHMLLYMGIKEKEGVEALQKEYLRRSGVRIIGVTSGHSSPFAVVEGIRFLRQGGLVSLSGDIIHRSDQKTVSIPFLGQRVRLPLTPYVLAFASGAPLFVFFAFRIGKNSYHFSLQGPITMNGGGRADRDEAVKQAARQYGRLLEEALRRHPSQWYHFDRFLEE